MPTVLETTRDLVALLGAPWECVQVHNYTDVAKVVRSSDGLTFSVKIPQQKKNVQISPHTDHLKEYGWSTHREMADQHNVSCKLDGRLMKKAFLERLLPEAEPAYAKLKASNDRLAAEREYAKEKMKWLAASFGVEASPRGCGDDRELSMTIYQKDLYLRMYFAGRRFNIENHTHIPEDLMDRLVPVMLEWLNERKAEGVSPGLGS